MAKMLVLDTEHTNKEENSEMTELGYIIVDLQTNKVEKHISYILYDTRAKPLRNRYYLNKYANVKELINNKDIIITSIKKAIKAFERDLRQIDIIAGYNLISDLDIINLVCDRLGFNSSVNNKQYIDIYFNAIWHLRDNKDYVSFCLEDRTNHFSPAKRMRFTQDLVYKYLFNEERKGYHVAYLDCKYTLLIMLKLSHIGKIKKGLRSRMYNYNEILNI